MIYNYITKPDTITAKQVRENSFSFSARDFQFIPKGLKNNSIRDLIEGDFVGEQINVDEYLSYKTGKLLGTISSMNGLLFDGEKGENISPKLFAKSTKKLIKNSWLISRNASLGKISYVNNDINTILNGGISSLTFKPEFNFYVPAFFISSYAKKTLELATSGGGTQQNAKRDDLLNLSIPFPTTANHANPQFVQDYISLLVQNIVHKEEQMALKNKKIDQLIETELSGNQKDLKFTYKMPTRSEVMLEGRLDTGLCGQEYKQLKFKIENYSGGSFSVPKEFLQSGSTPKIRNISNTQNDKNWVTPTYISDEGSFQKNEFINCEEQNIKKDCVLIINRTSKGKKGEFVGISCFYDFKALGKGHHNQGIYRLQKYTKLEQLMIVCFMNSKNYRTISGYMSYGSKMKELKSDDFSKFVFPTFLQSKQQEIALEYYNEVEEILSLQNGETGSPLQNYLDSHQNRNRKLGIFQLNMELFDLREELEKLVWDIVMGNEIKTI